MATAATRLRLVGRGGELAQLEAELRRAIAGELRCVLLLADPSSLEALSQLARNLSTSRVLIVLAARPAELSQHPIAHDVLLGLEQDGILARQQLSGLSREEVSELAAGVLEREPPAVFTDWLFTRSRGYPLFALGLVRTIVEEGGDLTAPTLERVPEELSDRVMSGLKQLDEPSLSTLEVLAVVGR